MTLKITIMKCTLFSQFSQKCRSRKTFFFKNAFFLIQIKFINTLLIKGLQNSFLYKKVSRKVQESKLAFLSHIATILFSTSYKRTYFKKGTRKSGVFQNNKIIYFAKKTVFLGIFLGIFGNQALQILNILVAFLVVSCTFLDTFL